MDFEHWLAAETPAERRRLNGAAAAASTAAARDAVWHHHLHTGETVRRIRTAGRTAAKVRANGQHGKLGAYGPQRSTVGEGTRAMSRSAEAQYFGRVDGRAAAAARIAAAHSW